MDNKKIIIITALILIICIVAGIILTLNSVNYERVEITPNGTSIEIPTNNVEYLGDTQGVKFWKWNYGALVTYNSPEGNNSSDLAGSLGFYVIKEVIKTGSSQNIDGFTVYTIDANKLQDSVKLNINGRFYCIYLNNETTHDNILICSNDKDVALHIAKSIDYKY